MCARGVFAVSSFHRDRHILVVGDLLALMRATGLGDLAHELQNSTCRFMTEDSMNVSPG